MTQRFCKVCRGWHDLDEPWPHNCRGEANWKRSPLAAPMLVRDSLERPLQSMVDGSWHDSKSTLRRTYWDNADGVRYIEIGNDAQRFQKKQKPKPDRKKIKDTLERARARYNRGERSDKTLVAP